jgi:hypothetical protein
MTREDKTVGTIVLICVVLVASLPFYGCCRQGPSMAERLGPLPQITPVVSQPIDVPSQDTEEYIYQLMQENDALHVKNAQLRTAICEAMMTLSRALDGHTAGDDTCSR